MRVAYQLRTAAAGIPSVWPPRRRVLYFDIDGTLVLPTFGRAKHALAAGRFERLVRRAGFDAIVCVSDAVIISRLVRDMAPAGMRRDVDSMLFRFCGGTFEDRSWFRRWVEHVEDPVQRASEFDRGADWYYIDDHAHRYVARAGIPACEADGRVLACDPHAEGEDVAAWLADLAAGRIDGPARHASRRDPPRYALDGSLAPYDWRRE